jgi:tungstate transport system permease protein
LDDLAALPEIVALSLAVSGSATLLAAILGTALAATLTLTKIPLRRPLIIAINALLGLPPVVVGLALYLLLSRQGPLGAANLLFTPIAMVIAQATLATPIIAALAHRALESNWHRYGRALAASGATRLRALPTLLAMSRRPLTTAILAGFGRTISEVGAVLIVGGNIAGSTRTMTTAIALETTKGNLSLALGLGLILIGLCLAVSASVVILEGRKKFFF